MKFCEFVSKYSKRIIYGFYTILLLYGIGLVTWGLNEETKSSYTLVYGVRIIVGVASILNAVVGLYGTAYGEKCLVYVSIIFLFTSCIAQILFIIIRITIPFKESTAQKAELQTLFDKEDDEYVKRFRDIELKMECCGVDDYNDYEEKFDPLLLGYPPSCCGYTTETKCLKPYATGCHQKLEAARQHDELYVSALVIAILTIWGDDLA